MGENYNALHNFIFKKNISNFGLNFEDLNIALSGSLYQPIVLLETCIIYLFNFINHRRKE